MRDRGDEAPDERPDTGPELDDADRALVDKLRALAPEGNEPDWKKLEAAIRAEVSPLSTLAPWWRNWRWLVPIGALATTAAIVMTLGIRRGDDEDDHARATLRTTMRDASVPGEVAAPAPDDDEDATERAATMWLDGEPADLDELSPEDLETIDAPDMPDMSDRLGALDAPGIDDDHDEGELGVLPAADYQWIDTLRDDEAARLETFLARKRS